MHDEIRPLELSNIASFNIAEPITAQLMPWKKKTIFQMGGRYGNAVVPRGKIGLISFGEFIEPGIILLPGNHVIGLLASVIELDYSPRFASTELTFITCEELPIRVSIDIYFQPHYLGLIKDFLVTGNAEFNKDVFWAKVNSIINTRGTPVSYSDFRSRGLPVIFQQSEEIKNTIAYVADEMGYQLWFCEVLVHLPSEYRELAKFRIISSAQKEKLSIEHAMNLYKAKNYYELEMIQMIAENFLARVRAVEAAHIALIKANEAADVSRIASEARADEINLVDRSLLELDKERIGTASFELKKLEIQEANLREVIDYIRGSLTEIARANAGIRLGMW